MQEFKENSSKHHFGHGYVTAYQLAIEFNKRHQNIVENLELDIGGKDTGEHSTLAKYLAWNLSHEIKDHEDSYGIEGAFLNNKYLTDLKYKYDNDKDKEEVVCSVNYSENGISMFRVKE